MKQPTITPAKAPLKLRIEQTPESKGYMRLRPGDIRIFINDVEQTHIRELQFRVAAHEVVSAAMVFYPTEIEIDAEVLATLLTASEPEPETKTEMEPTSRTKP